MCIRDRIETGLFVASDRVGEGSPEQVDGNVALAWGLVWFVSIVHSFVLNVYWLRWQEQRRAVQAGPAAYGSPVGFGSPVAFGSPVGPASAVPYSAVPYGPSTTASSGFPAQQGTPPHGFASQQFPSTSTTPWPAPTPWSPTAPTPAYGPVDVNTADAAQLATLEGFDGARVSYLLSERHRRGGFTSLADFAATAQLTPYQFERLQHRLTLSPPRPY